jgi:glycosyltransferase involved in cell wall biosynthesis
METYDLEICLNNQNPMVSVIVPIYNVASYVCECIESIQNQTYRNLEIILVDDGSTDGSGELCEEFAVWDDRIHVISQKNKGVVSARNRGIESAAGKYILFVDGDDWIEADMVEMMVEKIGEADLITTKVYREISPDRWVDECDKFPEGMYDGERGVFMILKRMLYDFQENYSQPFIPGMCNKLFLSSLAKVVCRTLDIDISYEEDAVFVYKYLLLCQSVVISHQGFYHYRYRIGSAVHSVNQHMLMNINKVYLTLEEEFSMHKMRDCLILQLQKWITHLTCKALNDFMGFDNKICIPEYMADFSYLEEKKMILYGAGKAGQDIYLQMNNFGFQVILWVDKNYKIYQKKGMAVESPKQILDIDYDFVYIAVSDQNMAGKIRQDLIDWGIADKKIIWRKPMHIF